MSLGLEKSEIIKGIRYKGPFIIDSSIPGERKADGVVPAHPGGGCIRVSSNRWIVLYATLDCRGWDSNRAIVYQIRSDSPDGPLIKEGLLSSAVESWDPFGNGGSYFKSNGMPIAFGVPKGATVKGKLLDNSNVFVVKWYCWAHKIVNGKLVNPIHHPEEFDINQPDSNLKIWLEWLQFRLNESENDIEIISSPQMLTQRGYENGNAIFGFENQVAMNHSMKAPCPLDDSYTQWVEYDTFVNREHSYPCRCGHGAVAAVKLKFNHSKKLYEWVETGPLLKLPGLIIGESCINRIGDGWVISLRAFGNETSTCWYYTEDPFKISSKPFFVENQDAPRTSFVCADGKLRLFTNDNDANYSRVSRTPLCCWDIELPNFSISKRRIIFDAGQSSLPFHDPMIDMAKLCPHQGNRQLLFYRVIAQRMTVTSSGKKPLTLNEYNAAGIYCSEIIYDEEFPDEWDFAENNK